MGQHHCLPKMEERDVAWQRELQSSVPVSLKSSVVVAGWAGVNKTRQLVFPIHIFSLVVHWRGTAFVPVPHSLCFWLSAGFSETPECTLSLPLPERVIPGFWKSRVNWAGKCYRNATHYVMWLKDSGETLNVAIDLFPLLQKESLVYQHEIS